VWVRRVRYWHMDVTPSGRMHWPLQHWLPTVQSVPLWPHAVPIGVSVGVSVGVAIDVAGVSVGVAGVVLAVATLPGKTRLPSPQPETAKTRHSPVTTTAARARALPFGCFIIADAPCA